MRSRTALVAALLAAVPVAGRASPEAEAPAPDVDGIGVLAIARAQDFFVDSSFAYADASEAGALAAGARLAIGSHAFLEGVVPVGWEHPNGAVALGNVMATIGLLPAGDRLVGVALRVAAATSPRVGNGMLTAAALAAPRNAGPELWLAHTTSAELVGDWRWRGAASWLQVEAGIAAWWTLPRYETVLRATVAGGVRVDTWLDLTASFVTRSFLLTSDTPEDFVHSLVLGVIAHTSRGQLALRLEVPIDASARNADRFLVGLELRGR